MEFKDAVNYRQSIRIFKDKEVPKDDLLDIINLAQRAPSWTNAQPWHVHVATGKTLKEIKEDHLNHYKEGLHGNPDYPLPAPNTWSPEAESNSQKWRENLGSFLVENSNQMSYSQLHLFDAPAIVYITVPKNASAWSIYDAGAFAQTLMLAAADKKIDSMVAYEFIKFPDSLRKFMNVDNNNSFLIGIALGYRDEDYKINKFRTDRAESDSFLDFHN